MMKKAVVCFFSALPFLVYGGWYGYNRIEVGKINRPIVPIIAEGEEFTRIGLKKVVITPHVRQWVTVIPREVRYGRFTSGVPTESLYAQLVFEDGSSAEAYVPTGAVVRDVKVVPTVGVEGSTLLELRQKGSTLQVLRVEEFRRNAKKG